MSGGYCTILNDKVYEQCQARHVFSLKLMRLMLRKASLVGRYSLCNGRSARFSSCPLDRSWCGGGMHLQRQFAEDEIRSACQRLMPDTVQRSAESPPYQRGCAAMNAPRAVNRIGRWVFVLAVLAIPPRLDGMGGGTGIASGATRRAFAQVLDVYERGNEVEP